MEKNFVCIDNMPTTKWLLMSVHNHTVLEPKVHNSHAEAHEEMKQEFNSIYRAGFKGRIEANGAIILDHYLTQSWIWKISEIKI